jgi:thiol:disulfide interchange protein DsbD
MTFRNFWSLNFILLALALPLAAFPGGKSNTTASIVLEQSSVAAGQPVRGVLHLQMEGAWHTYWKNAGDVGLATEVAWTLPEGWKADPLLWPAPHYLETSGLVSYAYEHQVDLPFILRPPADVAMGPVEATAKVSWLECDQACIPGDAELKLSFVVASSSVDGPGAAQVKAAFSSLPKARSDIKASKDGSYWLLHLPSNLAPEGATFRFFPDTPGQITMIAPQELVKGEDGSRTLRLQSDPGAEKPPTELSGVLVATSGDQSESFEIKTELLAKKPTVVASAASLGTILLTAGAAFLGGLVLNLMPCVFPVLSLKVLGIVEQSRQEGGKAWHHGVVFTIGVLVSFWVMSGLLLVVRAAGEEVGWGYHLQNPLMIAFLAALFLMIGLNLFGVFEVGESLTQLTNVADKKHGFAGSFWSGVLTTLAATPCTAPFMGSAVGFALSQPSWVAMLVFTSLALGVSAPYMTLTLFPALLNKLPRPGQWMITFKQILAFPMLLAVVWLTWVFGGQVGSDRMALLLLAFVVLAFACWVYGKWGHTYVDRARRVGTASALLVMLGAAGIGYQAARTDPGAEKWLTFTPQLVEQLVAEGKPVFLDFTADWCTSCKANELLTLSRPEVTERFEALGVTLVKGDWTNRDPVITAALEKHGRAGVPLYVLYPGQGKEPMVLPEVLFPATLLKALENVKKPS